MKSGMISPKTKLFIIQKIIFINKSNKSVRVISLLEFRLSSQSAMSFYLLCCWASGGPIISVEFKFVRDKLKLQ